VDKADLGITIATADVEVSSPPMIPCGVDVASPQKAVSLREEAGDVQVLGDAHNEDAPGVQAPVVGEVQDQDAPEVQATKS
jgi:hypothetical protein